MSRKLNQWASVGALCALAAGCAGDMQALKFWSTVDDAARVEDAIDPTEGSQADQEESASAAAGEVSADEQAGGALTTGPQALMTNEEGGDQSSPQINLAGGAENSRVRGFVRRAPTSDASLRRAGPVDHGTEELTLEFEGADLSSVVRVMMEEGLNANYLIDPSVQGTVTIRTNRPLTNGEILPTLEEILRMNDAALVERDGVFRILPRADAGLTAPLFSARDAAARGLSLRVTPLRFVSVEEVSEVLDAFAPVNGAIRYERSRNLVFSIGTASEQATILDAIDVLDADYFAGRSLALQPLREATAETLSGELVTAFASPSGAPSAAVRFLPIARMNAILIVADEASMLDEAMRLARDLDQGGAETPTLHVFTARRRRAADLALIIGDIFDAEVSGIASQNSFVAPNLSTSTGFSTIGGGRSGFGGGGAQAGLRAARTPGPPPPSATELTSSAIQVEAAPDFRRQRAGSGAPAGVFAQAAIDSVADGRFAGGGGGGLNGVVRVVGAGAG